jgi:NTE family protein
VLVTKRAAAPPSPIAALVARVSAAGTLHASRRFMARVSDSLEPNNLRLVFSAFNAAKDLATDLAKDLSFVRSVATALGPGPRRDPVTPDGPVFPPLRPLSVPALSGKRIGLVCSGGSGATASLCGLKRAFEEAGLQISALSACSGSVLFASLWACGVEAEQMARFWLTLPTRDYVDPDWAALARAPFRAFRGLGGLLRGDAIERTFERRLGRRTIAETTIPLYVVAWNIDENRVEYLSSRTTPDLTIARVVRIAISIPTMVEPVKMGAHMYGDGGIVDIFPTPPLRDAEPLDVIFGVNCYLPEGFVGEDIGDWYGKSFSILRASGQLRYATYLELAREHARELGPRLELLNPVPYTEVRGANFYETFLDRRSWPRFMQLGYTCGRAALEKMASAPR